MGCVDQGRGCLVWCRRCVEKRGGGVALGNLEDMLRGHWVRMMETCLCGASVVFLVCVPPCRLGARPV